MQRRVTIEDIARGCGVSRATVSLVLRGSPLPAEATRQRVQAEIERQGYVYNRAAANLRQRTSSSVALVVNDLANPYFAEFAVGVDEALGAGGYVTLLGSTIESPARQQRVLASLLEHAPAGIILSPAEGSDGARLQALIGTRTPWLVFNRELADAQADYLALDNRHGARQATRHLLELGHRRIAFFGGHTSSSSCRERRQGHADAMAEAGIEVPEAWLVETASNRLDAANRTPVLFETAPAPTAAVCYNDAVALGLMLGLAAQGLRPGPDFAVTGFDDIPEAGVSFPPLTTLATDPRARGRDAASRLLERIRDPAIAPRHLVAPARLVIRASTAAPAS